MWYSFGRTTAISPSSRYTTERVCASTAEASDATKFSPVPIATSSGEPCRAATIVSGSRVESTAIPYVPSTWCSAPATASTSGLPFATCSSIRCASTSVSVSERNTWPRLVRAARSGPAFSMMPLWMSASVPPQSVCGCALTVLGAPCVAQRVWAMPAWPAGSAAPSSFSSALILPGALCTSIRPSATTGSRCTRPRSEEHTSELQSLAYLVCRLLLEKKKKHRCTQEDYTHHTTQ